MQMPIKIIANCKSILTIFIISLFFLPSGFAAELDVTLQWDESIDAPYLKSYKIYYNTVSDPPYVPTSNYATHYKYNEGDAWSDISDISPYPFTVDKSITQIYLKFSDDTQTYFFAVTAVDTRGLESDYSNEVSTLDTTAPTVAISYSEPGPYRDADTITVTATFTETDAIAGTPQIAIDFAGDDSDVSATNMTEVSNKVWTYDMDVPAGNGGAATITITAFNTTGKAVAAHSGNTFIVDNTQPIAPAIDTNSGNDYSTTDSSITLEGTCAADTVAIYVNGSTDGVTYIPGQSSWSYSGTLDSGANNFEITAEDAAGNVSDAGSITVTYGSPTGGYTADYVIPSAQISQSQPTEGDGANHHSF